MAFLVAYKRNGKEVDWKDKAIYLDQNFYEMIMSSDMTKDDNPVLEKFASMGYGDEYHLTIADLALLHQELEHLQGGGTEEFKELVVEVLSQDLELAISGDMHPVLV